jgi:hypothetical protein
MAVFEKAIYAMRSSSSVSAPAYDSAPPPAVAAAVAAATAPGRLHMLAEFQKSDLNREEIRDELVTLVVAGVRRPSPEAPCLCLCACLCGCLYLRQCQCLCLCHCMCKCICMCKCV